MHGCIREDFNASGSPQDLLTRICTRSCKDLLERTSPGSPQDLLRRTCTISHLQRSCARSCKDLLESSPQRSPQHLATRACTRSHFMSRTFCASLRSRHALGHVTRSILRWNLQVKGRRPNLRPTFCASLRIRNAHGHVTRAIVCEISKKNAAPQTCAACFV